MLTIAVCGSTGAQGGAVVNSLLQLGSFKIRALTRNVESTAAVALHDKGVEVVCADFDKPDTLKNAFRGCYGAFLMTNYWEVLSAERELQQGKNLADAAKATGVKHVIWGLFEDTREYKKDGIPLMKDGYKVPHLDAKAEVAKYIKQLGIYRTDFYTCFFMENFATIMKFEQQDDGIYKLCLPMKDKRLPIVAVADIGKMVAVAFKKSILGKLGVASEHLTGEEIVNILSKVTGKQFKYVPISANDYRALPFPGAFELGNMFQFKEVHNDEFCKYRNMDRVKSLITPTLFEDWCQQNKHKIFSKKN